ncbi:hypothetical protein FBU30_002874 [Linnemannia zychae]|nr:hypothetical protein FBU30_002874 [Linnemannia zychae]
MDPKFQWTFTFFNSRGNQEIGLVTKRMPRSLDTQTIEDCVQEYITIVTNETSSSISTSKVGGIGHSSPCYNLRRQLVHSLADFGLDIMSYQSPMKPSATMARSQSLQKHFPPVSIKNYIYVISPLPWSWSETTVFLDGKKPSDTNLLGPRKSDILDVLKGIKDIFFELQLWDRFLDQRTSLSWIDTNTKPNDPNSTKTYRSLHISPGLGVAMCKDNWQALPSISNVSSSEPIPVNVMWSGELLCIDTLQFYYEPPTDR